MSLANNFVPTARCHSYLQEHPEHLVIKQNSADMSDAQVLTLNILLHKHESAIINQDTQLLTQQHTLADVYDALHTTRSGAMIITKKHKQDIMGVITWEMVRAHLLKLRH